MDASKVRSSEFNVHGLQDNNDKATNESRWWEELGRHGVDRKMWLSRVGHVDPFDSDRESWVRTLHRWFDHELLDIDNGIDHEPAVRVETAPSRWEAQRAHPAPGCARRRRPAGPGRR